MLDRLIEKLTDKMVELHNYNAYLIDNKELKREVKLLNLYYSVYTWVRDDQLDLFNQQLKELI